MSVAIDFVRRLLKDPPSLLNLVLLIFYALLDLYWALYSRSWPLTLLFYLPFCIPLECAFYLQVRRFLRERSAAPNTMFREESDPLEAQRCWERITAEAPSNVLAQMVRGWFLGEGEPGVDDVLDVISLTTFNRPSNTLHPQQHRVARSILALVENAIGERFPRDPSRNKHLKNTAWMAIEPLERCYKPLVFYLWVQSLHGLAALLLRVLGYEQRSINNGRFKYWHRKDLTRNTNPPPMPLVFLHGVGGLPVYWLLLIITSLTHRGVILIPIFPHCSLSSLPVLASAPKPPLPHELAYAIQQMLRLTTKTPAPTPIRCAFLAHSFGTAALACILKRSPELAASTTIIDPICFWFSGSLVRNFLYSKHLKWNPLARSDTLAEYEKETPDMSIGDLPDDRSDASGAASFTHSLQRKMATEEPTIQDAFRRRFWWTHMYLSPSDLPCSTHVILSGLDTVACGPEVRRHLTKWIREEGVLSGNKDGGANPKLTLEYHALWRHGWFLMHPISIYQKVKDLMKRAESAAPPTPPAVAAMPIVDSSSVEQQAQQRPVRRASKTQLSVTFSPLTDHNPSPTPRPSSRGESTRTPSPGVTEDTATTSNPSTSKTTKGGGGGLLEVATTWGVVRRVRQACAMDRAVEDEKASSWFDEETETASVSSLLSSAYTSDTWG